MIQLDHVLIDTLRRGWMYRHQCRIDLLIERTETGGIVIYGYRHLSGTHPMSSLHPLESLKITG